MKFMKLLVAAITLMGLISTVAFAVIEGYELTILHTGNQPPKIDGDLGDPIWLGVPSIQITWLDNPIEEVDEEYFSTVMVAYDNTYLYIAVRNLEPNPGKITTNFKGHDENIWTDDEDEVCIDPQNDSAEPFFKFTITPANVTLDSERGGAGNAWEADLESAAKIGKDNWVFEARMPFKALDVNASPTGQTWGFNVCRHIVSGVDLWTSWTTIGEDFNDAAGFGILTFSEETFAITSSEDKATTTWGTLKTLRSR